MISLESNPTVFVDVGQMLPDDNATESVGSQLDVKIEINNEEKLSGQNIVQADIKSNDPQLNIIEEDQVYWTKWLLQNETGYNVEEEEDTASTETPKRTRIVSSDCSW